jgi:hypothetical protein
VTRMSRRLLAGAIVVLIPALAGCEAGLNAPTANFHPAANGAYQTTGPVMINNAFVLGAPMGQSLPAGGNASVFLALYSPNGDQLTSISASDAQSVTVTGGTVNIPASTSVNLTGPTPEVVLTGLKEPLTAGGTVEMTFTFASARAVNLAVPIVPQANAYATFAQPSTAAPTPTDTATAAATIAASGSASASTKAIRRKHAHPSATASPTPSVTP